MAAIRGHDGLIKIGGVAVAALTSYTLDTTQDTAEASNMDSNARIFLKTLHGFSGSGDFVLEGPEASAQHQTIAQFDMAADTSATAALLLFPASDNTGETEISANIIITGYSITGAFDGVVTGSFTFQGTGNLVFGAKS